MPQPALVDLITQKVSEQLTTMNGQLEQLVAEAVDRELDELVERAVADRLAGSGDLRFQNAEPDAATKTCTHCNQEKPPDQFEPQRNVCRSCRRKAERDRARRRDGPKPEVAVPFDGGDGSP